MTDKPDVSPAAGDRQPKRPGHGGGFFEIRVSGHLDDTWSEWLEGLAMERMQNGEMILRGFIVDQAALLGILNKLSHLNLALISVREVQPQAKRKAKQSSGGTQNHK